MPKLTKRLVEAVEPKATDIILRDSEMKGFLCKITPKGKRVYMLYYRTSEGRERKPAIGEHGKLTCDQAREIAKSWLAEVHQGKDPSMNRQESRKTLTLAEFSEKYLRQYAKAKKPAGQEIDERLWRLHINPALGKYPINSINKTDIARLHSSLSDTPANANRMLALLKKAFNVAIQWGDLKTEINPAAPVKKYKEQARERFLSSLEIARLGDAIRQSEIEQIEMPSALLALRLLLLTGCRRNEILELQWEWIDFEHGKIDFPDSKTGKKSVYLNPPTLELLQNAPRVKGNPYVCTGKGGVGHLVNLQKTWSRIRARAECLRLIDMLAEHETWTEAQIEQARRESASEARLKLAAYRILCKRLRITLGDNGMEAVRLHDLRHSFASMGAAGGLSLLMIGKLLGHREQNTTQRYAHLLGDPLKEATNMIGNRIWAAMEGEQAEVIELRKK